MKLTQTWIETQEPPLCFHISSFTSSITKKRGKSNTIIIDFTFLDFNYVKIGILNVQRCKSIFN